MEEPSVLDYLKAKLNSWIHRSQGAPPSETIRSGEAGSFLEAFPETELPVVTGEESHQPEEASLVIGYPEATAGLGVWPWRSLLALGLALIAQLSLEPGPNRTWTTGLLLYLTAIGFSALAYLRGEWLLPSNPEAPSEALQESEQGLQVRWRYLWFSLPLLALAFLAFGGNRFTTLNVSLWLLASVLFILAFWQFEGRSFTLRQHWARWTRNWRWQITLTPASLVVLALLGLVVFFRVYRLDQVPPEMVSDHAEKLLDIWDVNHGQTRIFFPRNTGREAMQMYLTAAIIRLLGTGYTFTSLKIGTVLAGLLTLPFVYLLGKEIANRRAGLLAVVMAGIAYWPNVISRVGLRFPLYPLFVAPTLYFLIRGLRRRHFNDFILSGVSLGLGLHGYTPIRILPLVVVVAVGVYLLHRQSIGRRKAAVWGLVVLGLVSMVLFWPLLRYALDNPETFSYRSFTRLGSLEQPLPGPAGQIFINNLLKAVTMFAWDDGEIWVHSVTHRPALDVISAALFYLGAGLLFIRYLRQRDWLDLFLLLSVPLLMLPSILSLAFPAENPALNRMGGAVVPVFLIVALALDGWMASLEAHLRPPWGTRFAWGAAALLILCSSAQNYDLVFHQYQEYYRLASWNTSEMGRVIRNFADSVGDADSAWVVAYPYWVDTRLVGINAGYPTVDYALWPDEFADTLADKRSKLFLINPEDQADLEALVKLYPRGILRTYPSQVEGHRFQMLFVPAEP